MQFSFEWCEGSGKSKNTNARVLGARYKRGYLRGVGRSVVEGMDNLSEPHLRDIDLANELVSSATQSLGISPFLMPPGKIFLISQKDFGKISPKEGIADPVGFYKWATHEVIINLERAKDLLLHVLVHELTHAACRTLMHVRMPARGRNIRSGHVILTSSPEDSEGNVQEGVRGFALNEGITESIARELLRIPFDPARREGFYRYYVDMLHHIFRAIAREERCSQWKIWRRFKRAHFTGDDRHLDRLDLQFGPSSREILEKAGGKFKLESDEELKQLAMTRDYFVTTSREARSWLRDELLAM